MVTFNKLSKIMDKIEHFMVLLIDPQFIQISFTKYVDFKILSFNKKQKFLH